MMQAGAGIYVSDSGTWRVPSFAPSFAPAPARPPRKRRSRQAFASRTVADTFLATPILHAPDLARMALETRLTLAAAVQRVFLPDLLGAA